MQMAFKAVHITCSLFRYVTSTSRPARPVAELPGVEPVGDAPEAKHADRRRQRRIQARHNVRVQAHLQTDHLVHSSARCLKQRRGNTQMTNKMHCGRFWERSAVLQLDISSCHCQVFQLSTETKTQSSILSYGAMSAMARALSDGWSNTWPIAETPLSVRAARFQDTCSRGANPAAEHLPRLCQHLSTTGTSSGRHDAYISQSRRAQVATTARVSLRAHVCKQGKPAAVDVASCTL